MNADRLPCVVPFCRRTVARSRFPGATEFICGPHWRLARKPLRRLYGRARRRFQRDATEKALRRCWRLWAWIKAECVAAAGATP